MEHIQSIYRRNLYILIALWSFVFGVLVSSIIFIPPLVAVLIVVVAIASYYADRHVLLLIVLLSFSFGVLRFDIKDFHEPNTPTNIGLVVSEPERRDLDTRFVFESENGERALVTTDILSSVQYGDKVSLIGNFQEVKDGDYAKYLSKEDIYYTLDRARLNILESDLGNPILSKLFAIKGAFVDKARDVLPEPEASLLSGLIVSGKQALPKDVLEDFRRAGVVHIVVLSGYNIAVIAEFLLLILAFLGSRRATLGALVGVAFFTLVSGFSATVLRGAIMVSILLLGKLYKRSASEKRVLLFTAVLMIMYNPKYLIFDASFQLSFLALLGIIYLSPILEGRFSKLPDKFGFRSVVSTTLATQIFVLPFLIYNMGSFSLVFLLTNLLILPVLPIVMLIGLLGVLVAFVSGFLAWPIVFFAHVILLWILKWAEIFGNLPFSQVEIENFPIWGSLMMYLGIGFILWRFRNLSRSSTSLG